MGEATAHKAKRPHVKWVLCDVSLLATHGGRGKSLSVWVRLGSANRPHAERGTYHASVFGFHLVCGGMMSS